MAMIQAVNTGQIQSRIDDWIARFSQLVTDAEDLSKWGTNNLTTANNTGTPSMLQGFDGQPIQSAILIEMQQRLANIGLFAAWANTPITGGSSPTPDRYFRDVRRTIF